MEPSALLHFRHKLSSLPAMMRRTLIAVAVAWLGGGQALAAPETIGVHSGWAAFRDGGRCYAISEPAEPFRGGEMRPFATISHWPERGARAQLFVRLRFAKLRGAPVTLAIGERRFTLVAGGANAWAATPAMDSAILAAMRSGTSMSVETRARDGRAFADVYRLRGAATAIDAALLGCAPD
jgi:hypothetical protein